ncbi:MAG: hypothetical protein AAF573_13415 [Bacteroidota bacterium]
MENKNFDEWIKRALEHLDGEQYVPQDWSAMQEHLEAEVNGFDLFVQQSIGEMDGEAIVPMDWSLMESKLDAEIEADATADAEVNPQVEDIYLDAVAYDHLKNISPPYKQEHWEMMSARLDAEYAHRRKVIFTKALEAVVVLLLVWTGINFLPTKKTSFATPVRPTAEPIFTPHNQGSTNDPNLQSDNQLLSVGAANADVSSTSAAITTDRSELVVTTDREDFYGTNVPPTSPTISNDNHLVPNDLVAVAAIPSISTEQVKVTDQSDTKNLFAPDAIIPTTGQSVFGKKSIIQIATLPPFPSTVLPWESQYVAPEFRKRKLRTHEITFSMYTSADYNFVSSDFYNTKIRSWDTYDRGRFGYSGGFALGFTLNRFTVETGAAYNYISYTQRDEANLFGTFGGGYIEEQWEDAEISMIQIPLNVHFAFLNKKRWKMYSLLGAGLHMAAQNNFNFQLEDLSQTATRSPVAEQSEIANESAAFRGILEGGNFRENSYLTANLGFGLERKFTYRWSLFVQPVYQHYFLFEGIGPNQDRIHSGSIRFGAKVKIR